MGHRRRPYGGYRRSRERNYALEHIEAARRFSAEIGGLDNDVKDYFFSLSGHELHKILDEYGAKYGEKARSYATQTIPKWRSGAVTMSGMNAERLFALLPSRMPLQKKYQLTEGMWKHFGPSSKKTLRVGADASLDDIVARVREHITEVVSSFKIPSDMERRFSWISQGDVQIKQQILNHLREQEKLLVIVGVRQQASVLLEKLRGDRDRQIFRMNHVFQIGKHELHVVFGHDQKGVSLEDYHPIAPSGTKSDGIGWIIGIVVIVILFLLLRR